MANPFEYFREQQQKLTDKAVQRLNEARTAAERIAILREYDYYVLEGLAMRIGLRVPQMPVESQLREMLIDAVTSAAKTA